MERNKSERNEAKWDETKRDEMDENSEAEQRRNRKYDTQNVSMYACVDVFKMYKNDLALSIYAWLKVQIYNV